MKGGDWKWYNSGEIYSICITDETIQRRRSGDCICSHLTVTQQVPMAIMEKSFLKQWALSLRRRQVRSSQGAFLSHSHPAATSITKRNKIPSYGTVIELKTILTEMKLKNKEALYLFQVNKTKSSVSMQPKYMIDEWITLLQCLYFLNLFFIFQIMIEKLKFHWVLISCFKTSNRTHPV